jgi:predicted nucleic acid-binding protein
VIIVSNTSPITNLAAVHQLNLLQQLYGNIIIPEAVNLELTGVGTPVPGTVEVQTFEWIETRRVANRNLVTQLQQELDDGEAEAIALAIELNANRLLIDERRGRIVASRLGVKFTGVLGILIVAKRQGLISAVKPVVDDLIRTAEFRVAESLYFRILQDVGE